MVADLLEAARAIMNGEDGSPPVNALARCHWCYEFALTDPHRPDCPWLAMPLIVKALEAAERVVEAGHGFAANARGYRYVDESDFDALEAALSAGLPRDHG